jgi:hypothetical protein
MAVIQSVTCEWQGAVSIGLTKERQMLTVRNSRSAPVPIHREHIRARLAPLPGVFMWAAALLCVAALGDACAAADVAGCLATLPGGLV